MPYTPRTAREILRAMAARTIARSRLSDLERASALLQVEQACAEALATAEIRLERLRDAFSMTGASGDLLDERAAELPPGGIERLGAQAASGSVLRLTRQSASGTYTLAAGATFRRTDDSSQVYRTTGEVTWSDGETTKSGVHVVAGAPGEAGNCDVGTITRIEDAPDEIIAVVNEAPLTNGSDAESDGAFKARIQAYLRSLARCQPSALEYIGLTHQTEEGVRALYATLYEDPRRPGYSELLIDDGTGGAGSTRAGATSSEVVPKGGTLMLWHEAPATRPIEEITVERGSDTLTYTLADGHYVSIPERGIIYPQEGLLEPEDVWTVKDYEVYTGLVASLQVEIGGSTSTPARRPGWRAAGTRVRVLPSTPQYVHFDAHVLPVGGVALSTAVDQVKSAATAFMQSLAPGETMYTGQLIRELMRSGQLLDVDLYKAGTVVPLDDIAPLSHRHALRARAQDIGVIPSPED